MDGTARVDLYWLPLGAGAPRIVRASGRLFEAVAARRAHRQARDLYHAALIVALDGERYAIEMGPAWGQRDPRRGVVATGPVGLAWLGRSRLFRYEVRRWRGGTIPDLGAAVDSPQRIGSEPGAARRLLDLVPEAPALTWGRDALGTGDMWNSNSLVSWLLARSGHAVDAVRLPEHGRAPGWSAGLVVAGAAVRARDGHGRAARRVDREHIQA